MKNATRTLTFIFLLTFPILAFASNDDNNCSSIVYTLYKDFSWQAVLSNPDMNHKIMVPIDEQPYEVLTKYFDEALSSLFVKNQECVRKTGEACSLDFDPIFASQDSAATDLTIKQTNGNIVQVQFIYPSNGQKIHLEYKTIKTTNGWRISDIVYKNSPKFSLKQLLSGKHRP